MRFFNKAQTIPPEEAADALARGDVLLVDVRDTQERAQTRAAGSVHIPLVELSERHDELPRDRQLAFICASGVRNAMAVKATARHGLTAANVKGGLSSWARAGLPVETGPEPRASETKRSR